MKRALLVIALAGCGSKHAAPDVVARVQAQVEAVCACKTADCADAAITVLHTMVDAPDVDEKATFKLMSGLDRAETCRFELRKAAMDREAEERSARERAGQVP